MSRRNLRSFLSVSLGPELGQESGLTVGNLASALSMRQALGGPALLNAALGDRLLMRRIGADGSVCLLVDRLQLKDSNR